MLRCTFYTVVCCLIQHQSTLLRLWQVLCRIVFGQSYSQLDHSMSSSLSTPPKTCSSPCFHSQNAMITVCDPVPTPNTLDIRVVSVHEHEHKASVRAMQYARLCAICVLYVRVLALERALERSRCARMLRTWRATSRSRAPIARPCVCARARAQELERRACACTRDRFSCTAHESGRTASASPQVSAMLVIRF